MALLDTQAHFSKDWKSAAYWRSQGLSRQAFIGGPIAKFKSMFLGTIPIMLLHRARRATGTQTTLSTKSKTGFPVGLGCTMLHGVPTYPFFIGSNMPGSGVRRSQPRIKRMVTNTSINIQWRGEFSNGGHGRDKLADLQPGGSFLLDCSLQLWEGRWPGIPLRNMSRRDLQHFEDWPISASTLSQDPVCFSFSPRAPQLWELHSR